jgi:UDP-N-acetylmuramoyl-L-alanyl-D-glutamate--2,6-diaminopimelate ligase
MEAATMSHDHAPGVALDELLPAACRMGDSAVVSGCTSDPRRVRPGDAFVAILGDDDDGHAYVAAAVKRGAAAIIVERPVPVFDTPVYQVADTRIALGELCHAMAEHPSRSLRVIGVIGTQGKSTVIALLESIYTAAGCHVGVLSSLASYDGMSYGPGVDERMTPASLAARLARMEAAGCTHALVEMNSAALRQARFAGIELDVVCGTTVDAARLDLHHTIENYREHTRRALDYLSPFGVAVFNADCQVSCRWLSTLDSPSLTYGFDDPAQITADVLERTAAETVFMLNAGCESAAVRTTIVGDHHVANCLAAAAVALAGGVDLQTIAAGIERLQRLPARMEPIACGQDFPVFVDAADTACGLRATLRTARQLTRGRVICVLGDHLPTARHEAAALWNVVQKLADLTIVAGDDALWSGESDDAVQIAADRGEAIAWAVAAAEPGDVVVIAGSRGPTECGFGAEEPTEADVARELLYARSPQITVKLKLVG